MRIALRSLLRSPAFTITAILTLALGVGVNTAMFVLINALMLRPLPFPDPGRLAILYVADNRPNVDLRMNNRRKMFADSLLIERWSALNRSFESIGGYRNWRVSASGAGVAERLVTGIAIGRLFDVLQVKPLLGRDFLPEELRDGARVAILGHGYWQRQFAGDPQIVGRKLNLDGEPFTVVGVLPQSFQPVLPDMPRHADVWTTVAVDFTARGMDGKSPPMTVCQAVGRLRPGVSIAQAQSELEAVSKGMESEHRRFKGRGVNIAPASGEVAADLRPAMLVLLAAVGCVLLIACSNIAGLALARQAARERESAIQAALGASRWRLMSGSLAESLIISVSGSALGLFLAWVLLQTLLAFSPIHLDDWGDIRIDGAVLLFAGLLAVVNAALFGLLPALAASRNDWIRVIQAASAHPGGRGLLSTRNLLVTAEVALAVGLLTGAGLLLRSFATLRGVDTGFERKHLVTASLPLPDAQFNTVSRRQELVDTLTDRLSRMPGVEAVGFTNSMALAGTFMMSGDFRIEGQAAGDKPPEANFVGATPGYFSALAVPLLAGRYYTASEAASASAALINEAAARQFFGTPAQAVGRRIAGGVCQSCTIVGVTANIRNFGLKREPAPELYGPLSQLPCPTLDLALRTTGDPSPWISTVRQEIAAIAPEVAADRIRTIDDVLDSHTAQPRFNAMLLALFAALALLLAAIGVFGLTAYSVTRRTREIGVRMALGAERQAVLAMVLRQAFCVAGVGSVLGLTAAWAASGLLRSLLFGVGASDPVTYLAAAFGMLAITLLAAWIPARRASRVDPMVALRHD